jgi:hypothetical protein
MVHEPPGALRFLSMVAPTFLEAPGVCVVDDESPDWFYYLGQLGCIRSELQRRRF